MSSYSDYWPSVELTSSGRPKLLRDDNSTEIELKTASKVSIYYADKKTHKNGKCTITTHRIIWIGKGRKPDAKVFSLSNVKSVDTSGGLVKKGKILIHLNPLPGQTTTPKGGLTKLSFHDNQSDWFTNLESSLKNKAWVIPEKPKKKRIFNPGCWYWRNYEKY